MKKRAFFGKGYTRDMDLNWVVQDFGIEWDYWRVYATEWVAKNDKAITHRLLTVRSFLNYLSTKAPYALDVISMFKEHPSGHKVSTEEFVAHMKDQGMNSEHERYRYVGYVVSLVDYILDQNLSDEDDNGKRVRLFQNPFDKVKSVTNRTETVHIPLPYRYIEKLRQIVCPYPADTSDSKTPWEGCHFCDWRWAIDNLQSGNLAWMEVPPDTIDRNDPDCIYRTRTIKRQGSEVEVHEIWSPVMAMFLFTKLHLPLRSYQILLLDSGEGDTWRYEQGSWVENDKHPFKYGTPKRPYQKGVFRRIYDSMTECYSTGLYITTNKTADQNKEETQRGYTLPWQHEELLYWLEKLRNWQEKYNPIDHLTKGIELNAIHTGGRQKSENELRAMGEFAFLFRTRESRFPIDVVGITNPWYRLLAKLEDDIFASGQTLANGERLRFIKDYDKKVNEGERRATEFPLHSLRVSLITSYTMDTDLPLPVISKLLAGHTRLLMTIYYNKITPSVMAKKMSEAHKSLNDNEGDSLKNFLADADLNQIKLRAVCQPDSYDSIEAAISNRNPIGWEERATGVCMVGGNSVHTDENPALGGCWNGGPILKRSKDASKRVYSPVPHGPENCPRCRWHATDAAYLPALNSKFNQISYKVHQAAGIAAEVESQLESLKDELFMAEEAGEVFLKHSELQALERRYEKQRVEADEYVQDYIAIFNLINRIIEIEKQRDKGDEGQKLIAVGSADDLSVSMKFIETESELLHLSLLCDDAEFYPDLHDDLRKTPAITKRTNVLSRMMARSGYRPVFLEMDEQTQLIAGNAIMRKMAQIANSDDKLEGYRIAANYIEAQEYLRDSRLLDSGFNELRKVAPLMLSTASDKKIALVEVLA